MLTSSTDTTDDSAALQRCYSQAVETFLNTVSEAFAILDLDGRVLRANIAYRRLTGPAGGAHDASLLSYLEPDRRDVAHNLLRSLSSKSPSRSAQLRFRIGGQTVLVDAEFSLMPGDLVAFTGRDVTHQEALERHRLETAATREAVEQISDIGHWQVGRDLKVQCSLGATRMLGLDPSAPAPMLTDLAELVLPVGRAQAAEAARAAFETGRALKSTVRIRRADGSLRVLEIAGAPRTNARGQLETMHGVVIDRTSASLALESALDSDSTVRRFMRGVPVAIAMFDRDMRVMFASGRWMELEGAPESEILGACLYDLKPWFPERWRAAHRQAMRGETLHLEQDELVRPDGRSVWYRWWCGPWRDEDGHIGGVMLAHEDVTEKVRAARETNSSLRRLSEAFADGRRAVFEIDHERRTVAWDGDWRIAFACEPDYDSLIQTGTAYAQPGERPLALQKWQTHIDTGATATFEFHGPDDAQLIAGEAAGEWRSLTLRRVSDGDRRTVTFASVEDISRLKDAEVRVRAAEQAALLASAAKGEFFAGVSHDFRTPLNGVLAVADMLDRTRLDERQHEMVRLIGASGRTLLRVMDDLVEHARIEDNDIQLDVRPFDIEECLRPTLEATGARALAKGVLFDSFISASVDGVFRGDPLRIEQVVSNLLANALMDTDTGQVGFSVAIAETGVNEAILKITVSDTGPGLNATAVAKVFERGELNRAIKSTRGGSKLGLSVVKRLVDHMNGAISVASVPGVGSTFTVELPLKRDSIAALAPLAARGIGDLEAETDISGLHVLIAEDNPMNRRVIELITAGSDLDIVFAENGREAVDKFAAGQFDVVLMDLQMPVMNGVEAILAVRKWEELNLKERTPIIAVSANATPQHIEEARSAGADDHVAKPIVRETLFETIARLGRARQRSRTVRVEFDPDELDIDFLDLDVAV